MDFNGFVNVDNVLSFVAELRLSNGYLDENSVFAHDFDDFSNVGVDFLESVELLFEAGD